MHAHFQAPNFIGVGEEWGDTVLVQSLYKKYKDPPRFAREGQKVIVEGYFLCGKNT